MFFSETKKNKIKKERLTRGRGMLENFLSRRRAKMADRLIPDDLRGGRILDIGCGAVSFFLNQTKFKEKYGLDRITSQAGRDVVFRVFDIEEADYLPFNDNFFDAVVMIAVFEHIKPLKLIDVLREIKRTLKPNGRFILTTPCPWTDKLLRVAAKFGLVSPEEINEHKRAYSHKELRNCLEEAGFPKEKMNFGYFEFFLNSWAYADK
jgi:SAM-dependent methyltransferase